MRIRWTSLNAIAGKSENPPPDEAGVDREPTEPEEKQEGRSKKRKTAFARARDTAQRWFKEN